MSSIVVEHSGMSSIHCAEQMDGGFSIIPRLAGFLKQLPPERHFLVHEIIQALNRERLASLSAGKQWMWRLLFQPHLHMFERRLRTFWHIGAIIA